MIDPKNININDVPKQFCDGAFMGHNKDVFFLLLTNGNEVFGFNTTPAQMKLIQQMININIALYEKAFGEIPAVVHNAPIVSPIQMDSLGGDKK